jgi:dynein assembly factor with WDR repeat domains 1
MRLTRYYLRYYPPCLCLEYKKTAGGIDIKEIPLLTLSGSTNLDALAASIVAGEPLLSSRRQPQVRKLLQVLLARQTRGSGREMHMRHVHTLRPHALPLTNFSLSKCGRWLATGSYDKTCKITTFDGDRLCTGAGSAGARTLSGHSNVVFAVAFNAPFDSVVATGGFDKEARLWDARDGALMSTLSGHAGELICVGFSPDGRTLATGAMDGSARLWDVEHGAALHALQHEGEISCLAFDETGGRAATGSFDRRAAVWDVGNGACARKLEGHTGEIAAVQFNFEGSLLLSGATDGTVKLWDVGSGRPVHTLGARGSGGEVTDAVFNETGTQVAVARTGGMAEVRGAARCLAAPTHAAAAAAAAAGAAPSQAYSY